MFSQHCSYVPQCDQQWTFLTCREHLSYATSFFNSEKSVAEQVSVVNRLLNVTGLASCADTRAGGGLVRGLSGGQKRRLSRATGCVIRRALEA